MCAQSPVPRLWKENPAVAGAPRGICPVPTAQLCFFFVLFQCQPPELWHWCAGPVPSRAGNPVSTLMFKVHFPASQRLVKYHGDVLLSQSVVLGKKNMGKLVNGRGLGEVCFGNFTAINLVWSPRVKLNCVVVKYVCVL